MVGLLVGAQISNYINSTSLSSGTVSPPPVVAIPDPIAMTGFMDPIEAVDSLPQQVLDLTSLGLQAGDFILVGAFRGEFEAATFNIADVSYTQISALSRADSADSSMFYAYKISDGTETQVTIDLTSANAGASIFYAASFRNVDATNPLDVPTTEAIGNNNSYLNPAAITPVSDGSMVVSAGCVAYRDNVLMEFTDLSFYDVSRQNTVFNTGVRGVMAYVGTKTLDTPETFDPDAFATSNTSGRNSWVSSNIVLRRAPATASAPPPVVTPVNPAFGVGEAVEFPHAFDALGIYSSIPNKTVITEFQAGHGFNTNSGGSHNYNSTTSPIIGTQHFELTTNGAQGYKYCQDVPLPASHDLTGKHLAILMKIDGIAQLDEFQVLLGNNGGFASGEFIRFGNLEGSQGVKWFGDNEWGLFVLPINTDSNNPTFDFTDVSAIRIAFRDNAVTPLNVCVQAIATFPQHANPAASIIFDDAHESVDLLAAPVMIARGIKGCIASPHDVLGQGSYMDVSLIQDLQNNHGWEVAAHATGNDMTAMTEAAAAAYLMASRAYWSSKNLFVYGWVYSGGEWGAISDNPNKTVRELVQDAGFAWARTVHERIPASLPAQDPMKLPTVYVTNADSPASVIADIDQALAAGMWPIIVFHRIVEGATSQTTEYNLADFTTIMDHLANQGIDVQVPSVVIRR